MQHRNKQKAFTLVELLLVVTIIGILAGAVLVNFGGQSQRAKETRANMDIQNIGTALSMYEIQIGSYPTSDQGLQALYEDTGEPGWQNFLPSKKITDPWGNEYRYSYPGTHDNEYDLYSLGADGQEGTEDDIGNWSEEM
jgi:general secretion pathway protein G